ncbi:MAG: hypothetical protein P4L53_06580 [Candidatus Obscuribacterales bacterium]|nr:hypothetical protein [Candidatus Obscuribacterales bacterium]
MYQTKSTNYLLPHFSAVVLLAQNFPIAAMAQEGPNPDYPPLINVTGTQFYSDSRGSVVNEVSEKENKKASHRFR